MRTKHFTYDQDKVKELRMAVIHMTLEVLNDDPKVEKWSAYKKELVSKIAPRVLPVLQEHSGTDGKPLEIQFVNAFTAHETGGDNN